MKTIRHEDVVIGGGIAGAFTAHALARKGRKPLLIDRGVSLDAGTIDAIFQKQSVLTTEICPKIRVRFQGERAEKRLPAAMGGLARFYAGVSLRMREREFDRWPFPYAALEPFYSEAEAIMRVSGRHGVDPTDPPYSRDYPLPLPPMSALSARIFEGAQRYGAHPFQHPFAIDFKDCMLCNYCNQVPCPVDAKWSPDRVIQALRRAGTLDVVDRALVRRVEWEGVDGDAVIRAVEFERGGETVRCEGERFFFAAGALLTPLLLLKSGLGERAPLLGTHLMTHCLGLVLGVFPDRISSENGFHKWFSVADYYFDDAGGVRGLIQQDHLTTWERVVGRFPRALRPIIEAFYFRTCQLLLVAEDDPQAQNRVDPRSTLDDVTLIQRFSDGDRRRRAELEAKAKGILRATGAWLTLGFAGRSVYHSCGTARMGADPAASVTDPGGKLWGVRNGYVADASTFPTSSGVNPSLTIAANALRIAGMAA